MLDKVLSTLESLFKKIPVKARFLTWVVTAFAAMICFFNVNSVMADKLHINWLLITVGVILSLAVIGIFKIANDENKQDKE
jgi:hypothetical protein